MDTKFGAWNVARLYNGKETGCEDIDWINLAQDRVQRRASVKTVMNLRVIQNTRNFVIA